MTLIIAEAGVNHNGNGNLAFQLVDVAHKAGADIVKFQTFKAKNLTTVQAAQATYQIENTNKKESQLDMLTRLELDYEIHHQLVAYCKELGIEFLSTAFDSESLHFLVNDLGLRRLKIPSGEITNAPLVLEHARTGCDLIVSTGMATLGEIEAVLGVIAFGYIASQDEQPGVEAFADAYASADGQRALQKKVTLLHCTTEYPAPINEVNLRAMDTMTKAFDLPVGYSDHTGGLTVSIAAVARGAVLLEKHFTLDKNMEGPDHKASLNPKELENLVITVRQVEQALGSGVKYPTPSEKKNKVVARKSLVAAKPIRVGEEFNSENIVEKRPGTGLSPFFTGILKDDLPRKIIKRVILSLIKQNNLKPIVVLGGGGHASVLIDILREQNREILAIISPDDIVSRTSFVDILHLKNDQDILKYSSSEILLVNGIGALPKNDLRSRVARYFVELGYGFETVVSSYAVVSPYATLVAGSQVLHNTIVQPGAFIGENTIVNTGAIIEHDCYIGMNNHVAPRATLCGQVCTGQNVYIGAGATVIQDIKIGNNILIGAGAIIVNDVPDGRVVYGYRSFIKKGIS